MTKPIFFELGGKFFNADHVVAISPHSHLDFWLVLLRNESGSTTSVSSLHFERVEGVNIEDVMMALEEAGLR